MIKKNGSSTSGDFFQSPSVKPAPYHLGKPAAYKLLAVKSKVDDFCRKSSETKCE